MTNNDKENFAQIMTATMGIYNRNVSSDVMRLWWGVLNTYEMSEINLAFNRYLRDPDQGKFPPTPAAIIGMIEPNKQERGTFAFQQVWDLVRKLGPYKSPEFDDAPISHVITSLGGWPHICATWKEDQRRFLEQEFVRLYNAYLYEPTCQMSVPLVGITEQANRLAGVDKDERAALAVENKNQRLLK